MTTFIKKLTPLMVVPALLLAGCGDSDNDSKMKMVEEPDPTPTPVTYTYEVTITNLTLAQPMSPIAVLLHDEGQIWQVGAAASDELEALAESGDNEGVLGLSVALASRGGAGMLMPGMAETISVDITNMMPMKLSMATMLVNTNDAFTGLNAVDITNLAVGESISLMTVSYDAGTEKNTESMASIPGPASDGAGEGFNAERDDVNFVAMHPGVVTQDDGLSTSVLMQDHRFDNPTLKVEISRTQ